MISKEIEVYNVLGDLDETIVYSKVEMRHYKPTDTTELLVDGKCVLIMDDACVEDLLELVKQMNELT
jgi:hypothetical protein